MLNNKNQMKIIKKSINFIFISIVFSVPILIFNSCSNDLENDTVDVIVEEELDDNFETLDWTAETHSKNVDPNFDEVFEDNTVKRIDIVITANRWQNMDNYIWHIWCWC